MRYVWETNRQPQAMLLHLHAAKPQKVTIAVYDWKKPDTFYSKQTTEISGNNTFEISLPLTPQKAFFEIHSHTDGATAPWLNTPAAGLKMKAEPIPFKTRWNCNFSQNQNLKDFLNFAAWFSEYAGILSASYGNERGSVYHSQSGKFKLTYVDEIIDDQKTIKIGEQVFENPNFGKPSPTSFRVESNTKAMEAAKKYVSKYSVVGRFALLTHEYAHGFINQNPDSEFEADENAIDICGCMGFNKREIANVFAEVFLRNPTDENVARMEAIKNHLKVIN